MTAKALAPLRICDFTGQLAGAGATKWLAAFGADLRYVHLYNATGGSEQHRIDRGSAVLGVVKRFKLGRKLQQLGPDLFPKQPVAVGRTEKTPTQIIGMIKASL